MVQNETIVLVENVANSTGANALTQLTAAQISSTFSLSALEGDFVTSRVIVGAVLSDGPQPDTTSELREGPFYLVLARGDMTAAQVTAALDGSLNVDLTPAGGTLNKVSIAQQRGIILMIPFENKLIVNDEAAAELTAKWTLDYNGPPLGLSLAEGRKRSYTFPKNIGWRWHVFAGGDSLDDDGFFNMYCRHVGRFTDD